MNRGLRSYALMLFSDDPFRHRIGSVFAVNDEAMLACLAGDLKLVIEAFTEGELRRVDDGELLWLKGSLDA